MILDQVCYFVFLNISEECPFRIHFFCYIGVQETHVVVHSLCYPSIVQGFTTSLGFHASSLGPGLKFLWLRSYARSGMGTSMETSESHWSSHLQWSLSQDRVRGEKLLQCYFLCGSLVLETPYSLHKLRTFIFFSFQYIVLDNGWVIVSMSSAPLFVPGPAALAVSWVGLG